MRPTVLLPLATTPPLGGIFFSWLDPRVFGFDSRGLFLRRFPNLLYAFLACRSIDWVRASLPWLECAVAWLFLQSDAPRICGPITHQYSPFIACTMVGCDMCNSHCRSVENLGFRRLKSIDRITPCCQWRLLLWRRALSTYMQIKLIFKRVCRNRYYFLPIARSISFRAARTFSSWYLRPIICRLTGASAYFSGAYILCTNSSSLFLGTYVSSLASLAGSTVVTGKTAPG